MREALSEQSLDFIPGLVAGNRQQILGVFRSEAGREDRHAAEVEPPVGQHLVDDRELPSRTRSRLLATSLE